MTNRLSSSSKGVAHSTPGRTRLKLSKRHRKHLHKIKDAISAQPGVKSVEINHDTGSLLVHHEHEFPIFEVLHKAVETVGPELLTTLIEGETAELAGGVSLVAAGVGLVAAVGKTVLGPLQSEKTPAFLSGKPSDLKTIVPTAFLIAAAIKAYETRTFWQGVTPMVLAYWAFDTYWRFNVANPGAFEPKNGQVHEHEHAKKS